MGELATQKGKKYWQKLAFLHLLGGLGMCQYPLSKSRVEKNFAFANLSERVSIWGKGSMSVLVIVLSLQKSTQSCVFFSSSLLFININGAE